VRPPGALRRRTHLSDRLNSHRLIRQRQDRLVLSYYAGDVNWALVCVWSAVHKLYSILRTSEKLAWPDIAGGWPGGSA